MNTDRFDRELPDLLAQLAPRAVPEYRNDIVRQTAHMRQRPVWMFPERWLPLSAITSRAFAAPPVRWRVVALVALLLLTLAVGLVLVTASQRHVPAPFGRAANGLVAYEKGGEIYTADPVTGVAKAVVIGTARDLRPVFSPDGTHLVFERVEGETTGRLVVANADGSGLVVVTPQPMTGFDNGAYSGSVLPSYSFSPDGRQIAVWSWADVGNLWIVQADGSGMRKVDAPLNVVEASWLPPDGAKLIVTANTNGGTNGIYAVDPRSNQALEVVAPARGVGVGYVRVSPDGSRIAYSRSNDTQTSPDTGNTYQVHVVGIDGHGDRTLPMPAGAAFQDAPAWSNDGTRLAITRGYAQHNEDMALAVVPADGSGTGVESTHGLTGCCDTLLQWSPDDTSVLVMPEEMSDSVTKQHLLFDPSTGATTPAPWTASDPPAWQRTVR
jgi:dipeptidyl aminopeptidase/acylaminoacyl peptidase